MTMKVQMFDESIKDIKGHLKDYLDIQGVENLNGRFICINPDHADTHPSATIFNDDNGGQHLKCWSCLPYYEEVKTTNGNIPIGNISIGDNVLTRNGRFRKVYNKIITKNKECKNYNISTYSYHPGVTLTEDHSVFVISDSRCNKSITSYWCNHKDCSYLRDKRCKNLSFKDSIIEKKASEIVVDDMLLYPIYIPQSFYLGEDILENFTVDDDLFWLFGIYLAEGNTYSRVVEFTFHEDEEEYITKTIDISKKYFNCNYSFRLSMNSKAFKIRIHSSIFEKLICRLFGTGSFDKKIPGNFYNLKDEFKKSFIKGIFDGDGVKSNGKLTLVNKAISDYYYDSMLYFGVICSFSSKDGYTDSDGLTHSKTYSVYPFSGNSFKAFFIEIENVKYLASGVKSIIASNNLEEYVYDISVEEDESFVTSGFMVHNCGHTSDIFAASHILENMPVSGVGFFTETVPHLAGLFNIELPEYSITDKEREEIMMHRLYRDAANYITSYDEETIPENIMAELTRRGWVVLDKAKALGIGFVRSYDSFRAYLRSLGHTVKIIEESGLSDPYVFNENRMLFVYNDEHGRPVGFIGRNLRFDGIKDPETHAYINGPKYVFNKSPSNGIKLLRKEQRLYLFDKAKRTNASSLYVVEGQPDSLSFHYHGYDNFVSLSGVNMTLEHFELLRRNGIYDVVVCLDNDAPGQKAAESLVDTVLKHVTDIRVRFMFLPMIEGNKIDPDIMARDGKFEEFFDLPKINPFDFTLNKVVTDFEDHDPEFICNKVLPTIISDPSSIRRETMISTLSNVVGISERALKDEVKRLMENKDQKVVKLKSDIIAKLNTKLSGVSPVEAEAILSETIETLRQIDKESSSEALDPKSLLGTLLEIKRYEEGETLTNYIKVDRNLDIFMTAIEGDLSQKVIFLPAPPNTGGCL
jgi:DNA primase